MGREGRRAGGRIEGDSEQVEVLRMPQGKGEVKDMYWKEEEEDNEEGQGCSEA